MSTLSLITTGCASCGASVQGEIAIMVNADRRPDLRRAVIEGTFNRLVCGACGHRASVVRTVGLFDWGRKQYLVCYPRWAEVHWRDLSRATDESLHRNLAVAAPRGFARTAEVFRTRVVFGYDSLREKLLAWDAGLDDVAVEQAKMTLLQNRPDRAGRPIWLWEVTDDALRWVVASDPVERVESGRALLGAALPPELSRLDLMADAFVDLRRWLVTPRPADPLAFDLSGQGRLEAGGARLREPFEDPF